MRNQPNIVALDWRASPAEVAARWPRDQRLLWLHSGRVHPRWARWSILAAPTATFRFDRGRSLLDGDPPADLSRITFTHEPLRDLDAILAATSLDPQSLATPDAHTTPLPFRGGWIGTFSYDLGRIIEPRAQHTSRNAMETWPLIELAWCPDALVFDHVQSQWFEISATAQTSRFDTRPWKELMCAAKSNSPGSRGDPVFDDGFHLGKVTADITPPEYESMVARTIENIAAGDIFQANIAQTFRAPFEGTTRALAIEAFEKAQPWYGAYLELHCPSAHAHLHLALKCQARMRGDASNRGRALLSLSPELFLQLTPPSPHHARRIVTRPIKGTRPASCDPRELFDSIKDEAELNMIVDLMRNDLGRVCEFGSVRVPQPRAIETHPTVHHGVAEITGRLREGATFSDVLRATFPPGSVTGAPKIRAIQIIDELESCRPRGPYCGAIGFISDCGAMTLNVAIRTMLLEGAREADRFDVLHDGAMSYSAGAGIVADSIPAREQQETLDKAAVVRDLMNDSREEHPGRGEKCPRREV